LAKLAIFATNSEFVGKICQRWWGKHGEDEEDEEDEKSFISWSSTLVLKTGIKN